MIVISMKEKNMPEWDVVKATPIRVPLTEKENDKSLIFEIPSVEKYFDFEAYYAGFISEYCYHFTETSFLSYKEFKNKKLKEDFLKGLRRALANRNVRIAFKVLLAKYFILVDYKNELQKVSRFKKICYFFTRKKNKNIYLILNVLKINAVQCAYCLMLMHNCIEFVKKKFEEVAIILNPQVLATSTTSLSDISGKPEHRFHSNL